MFGFNTYMNVKLLVQKPYITLKNETQYGISRKKIFPRVIKSSTDNKWHITNYTVIGEDEIVGSVSVIDKKNGIWVDYIRNFKPRQYSGFGAVADQIEVEHCLNRGLDNFKILSEATPFSLPYHYNRGKRFGIIEDIFDKAFLLEKYGTQNINNIMENLLKKFKVNEIHEEMALVNIPMYMPKELIDKYLLIIQKYPLLNKSV